MIAPGPDDLGRLLALVSRGGVMVLSGAGISTDSGIPDYRGPDGHRRGSPMTFQQFVGSASERQRYWARSHLGWRTVARAQPNVSHHAVRALQDAGLVGAVVTQNVDGLHRAAGSEDVIDLHGRLDAVRCLACDDRRPRLELALRLDALNRDFDQRVGTQGTARPDGDVALPDGVVAGFRVPACRRCGGLLKPDVVFFGEAVPRRRVREALEALTAASLLLVLGSSLTVGSGYRFVQAARRHGVPIAIVNRGSTRGDAHAQVKLDAGLADVLPILVHRSLGGALDRSPPR
jgi:NAD-dependent SIR2 family protein deacetylase